MFTPSPKTSPSFCMMSPRVDTDADVNLFVRFFLCVVGAQLILNLLGALHSMNDRGKVYQEGITDSFDDRAVILGHSLLDDLIMRLQQSQRTGFISTHLTAKADDVGKHNRR